MDRCSFESVDRLVGGQDARAVPPPMPLQPPRRSAGGADEVEGAAVVAFSQVEYIVYEMEERAELTILRRGSTAGDIVLDWYTTNRTMDPRWYIQCQGQATIPSGEQSTLIEVRFRENPLWNYEATFTVEIEVVKGYAAPGDLRQTSVVVLNEDSFPHNAFGMIDPQVPYDASAVRLSSDPILFKKMCAGHPELCDLESIVGRQGEQAQVEQKFTEKGTAFIRFQDGATTEIPLELMVQPAATAIVLAFLRQTWLMLHGECLWAVFYSIFPALTAVADQIILMLALNLAEDTTSYASGKAGARGELGIYCICMLLSFAGRHWAERQFRHLRLRGKATDQLRHALFNTMIQYTGQSQEHFSSSAMTTALNIDVPTAVMGIWVKLFTLIAVFFQLTLQTVMFIVVTLQQSAPSWTVSFVFISMLFNVVLMRFCARQQAERASASVRADERWNGCVDENSNIRDVVTGYRKGPQVSLKFCDQHRHATAAYFRSECFEKNVMWASHWCPQVLMVILLFVYADRVMDRGPDGIGKMQIGTMVALLKAIDVFGQNLKTMFEELYAMTHGYSSILRISGLLNADTRRKQLYRAAVRRKGLKEEHLRRVGGGGDRDAFEELIQVRDLAFAYPRRPGERDSDLKHLLSNVTTTIQPGRLVLFTHQQAYGSQEGSATLLRLLARQLIPTQGFISYPGNWRVRYVESLPKVFPGTLWANLVFGVQHTSSNGEPLHTVEEVCELLDELGLNRDWARRHMDNEMGHAGGRFNVTTLTLIGLARALLSSPGLLLIANTLDPLGVQGAGAAISTLRRLVLHRGLPCLKHEFAITPAKLKKPRTVVVSTRVPEIWRAFRDHGPPWSPPIGTCPEDEGSVVIDLRLDTDPSSQPVGAATLKTSKGESAWALPSQPPPAAKGAPDPGRGCHNGTGSSSPPLPPPPGAPYHPAAGGRHGEPGVLVLGRAPRGSSAAAPAKTGAAAEPAPPP